MERRVDDDRQILEACLGRGRRQKIIVGVNGWFISFVDAGEERRFHFVHQRLMRSEFHFVAVPAADFVGRNVED